MNDQPKPASVEARLRKYVDEKYAITKPATGEWTALKFFGIVHGKGDAGSKFAFYAQNPELQKGWVRLAVYASMELAKQLAAEREKFDKVLAQRDYIEEQLIAAEQSIATEQSKNWIRAEDNPGFHRHE